MQKISSIVLSGVIIFIGSIVLLLCVFTLPRVAEETIRIHPEVAYLKYPILFGMYATAVPFFYALYETVKMIQIARRTSIFSSRIIQVLNTIKYCAFVIIALYIAGICILDHSDALPPIIAFTGFAILLVTVMVAAGAAFIKNVLLKTQMKVA